MAGRVEGHYNVSIHPRSLRVSWEMHDRVFRPRKIHGSSSNISGMYDDPSPEVDSSSQYPLDMPDSNKQFGLISIKAKKRISDTIDWLCAISQPKSFYSKKHEKYIRFRLNFITLTLSSPQIHSDNKIKSELLNNFITQLRAKWKVKRYFWRAESQLCGRIHFHLVTDTYIPWWELRHTWNKIQNNLGYIDRFEKIHGHRDPNSTDVHATKNIRKINKYIAKVCSQHTNIVGGEVSKNSKGAMFTPLMEKKGKLVPCFNPSRQITDHPQSEKLYRTIEGNLWGRSFSLSRIKAKTQVVAGIVQEELEKIESFFKSQVFSGDYYHVISVPVKAWANVAKGKLHELYLSHIAQLRYHDPAQIPIPI